MDDWYWPQGFEPGAIYVDADGENTLEFTGVLTARAARGLTGISEGLLDTADDGERVLVFMVVDHDQPEPMYYTHTKSDADRGYGFIPSTVRRPADCGRSRRRAAKLRSPST
ncbi:MAG: hypothetical protein ABIZ69_06945 [Ilumatobacteraceae bacterium]